MLFVIPRPRHLRWPAAPFRVCLASSSLQHLHVGSDASCIFCFSCTFIGPAQPPLPSLSRTAFGTCISFHTSAVLCTSCDFIYFRQPSPAFDSLPDSSPVLLAFRIPPSFCAFMIFVRFRNSRIVNMIRPPSNVIDCVLLLREDIIDSVLVRTSVGASNYNGISEFLQTANPFVQE